MAKIYFNLAEFKNYTIKDTVSYAYHGKDTIEINYVVSGSGKVKINDKIYDLKEHTYFVIPEFVSYSIIAKDELEIYSAYFVIDDKIAFKDYIPYLKKIYVNSEPNFTHLFKSIHDEFLIKTLGYNEIITSSFKVLVVKVVRNEGLNGKRLSHWSLDSLQFSIDKIFSDEFNTITIKELAFRLNMSVRDLQRYLLKNYDKSFSDLKKDFKLEYAKIRLIYYKDSIEKISDDLNFSTREHFSYFFKKATGFTPLSYRKQNKMD
jgi:AraC-like DNA-binding protein